MLVYEYEQEMNKLLETEEHGLGPLKLIDIWHETALNFSERERRCLSHFGKVGALEVGETAFLRSKQCFDAEACFDAENVTYSLLYRYLEENSDPHRAPWVYTVKNM